MENEFSEIEALQAQLDTMQQSLEALNNRIAEMENN
jgi:prefoldin subunit 5